MPYYVNAGAKLKCSMGSAQSSLGVVQPVEQVYLCGKLMANIMDSKPMINIKPFGKCKSLANPVVASATAANYGRLQEMPCIPNTTVPWLNGKMNLLIKGSLALLDTSKCMCMWAGVIEVADPGQRNVKDGGPMTITVNEPTLETLEALGSGSQLEQGIGANVATHGAIASGSQTSQSVTNPQNTGTAVTTARATKTLIKEVRGASDAYPRQEIEYEVSRYNKEKGEVSDYDRNRIRWALKVDGRIGELNGKRGEKITLEIEDLWAGKEIVVMACLEGFNESVSQKTSVGPLSQRTLVRGVKGSAEANSGQDVEYEVSSYNRDMSSVSDVDKNRVRWAIGLDGRIEELKDKRGEKVLIKMREEWVGKEITVLACIEGFNFNVSQKTRINLARTKSRVTEMYWSYGDDYKRLTDNESRFYVNLNLHVKTENYKDGDTVSVTVKRKDGQLLNATQVFNLSGTIFNNKVVFKNVFREYV